jgi:preprotein translocase subunit SecF
VKLVFPFDSPLTILPLVAVAAILVFYTLLLIKLKPSNENIETTEKDSIELEKPMMPTEPSENESEDVTPAVQEEPAEASQTEVSQTEANHTEVNALNGDLKETKRKTNKDEELKKSFFLFGERQFEGCPHKFGYLKSLRKNAPIPDECFGCPQILECLMTRKNK